MMDYTLPNLPSKCKWRLGAKPRDSVHCHLKPKTKPKIYTSVLKGIGDTPLIRLNKIPKEYGIKCEMYAKCEFFNPGGSIKDRIALRMIEDAEKEGKLKPGSILIEATSGNTGIGLSLVAAVKGYRCIIIMPEHYSGEKLSLLQALGAEIVRTPKNVMPDHPESPHRVAHKLCNQIPNSLILNQFRNSGNPLAHYDITAEEIFHQLDGKIDMIVAGTGTGATITGIGRKVKDKFPNCKIIGCDPFGYYSNQENMGAHDVEGIGLMFQSTVLDPSVVDEWIQIADKYAFQMTRTLIRKEGLLCGGSSGSVLCAGLQAAKELTENQKCVLIFGDGIRNYMAKLMDDDWLMSRGFMDIPPKITEKHWWWNFKVSSLELSATQTVLPSINCQDVVEKMKNSNAVPVVNEIGNIIGLITLETVMANIVAGKVKKTTKVSEMLCKNYVEITHFATLGHLSMKLNQELYALVIHKDVQYLAANKEATKGKPITISTVTKFDLISFIISRSNGKKLTTDEDFEPLNSCTNGEA